MIIGTRGSKLALVQAHWVSDQLTAHGVANKIEIIKTKGDLVQDRFDKMEGKGFFTTEIEEALRSSEIDLAVHCLKDLPTTSPEDLVIRAIPKREDPFDVIISGTKLETNRNGHPILNGKSVGTSSNRRVEGLRAHFPQARFTPIRGNVPTRIQKMLDGQADMVVLARAGLNRLDYDLSDLHVYPAEPPLLVPAPGQGALALQMRADDSRDISFFHCEETALCVAQERRILNQLEGGCQLPLGVLIQRNTDGYSLNLFLGSLSAEPNDKREAAVNMQLSGADPEALTESVLGMLRQPEFKG